MQNIAVLAPMPTASVKTTTGGENGCLTQHPDGMPQIANESVHVYWCECSFAANSGVAP
jgi:hypothetical protein